MKQLRRAACMAAAAGSILAVSACGGGPAASPAGIASPSPSADPAAPALAAYQGFITTYIKAGHTANADDPDLAKYLGDPMLANVTDDLRQQANSGRVYSGTIASHPVATKVDPAAGKATLTDCLDLANWHTLDKATGQKVTIPGQVEKYGITAQAARDAQGQRRVTDTVQRQGC